MVRNAQKAHNLPSGGTSSNTQQPKPILAAPALGGSSLHAKVKARAGQAQAHAATAARSVSGGQGMPRVHFSAQQDAASEHAAVQNSLEDVVSQSGSTGTMQAGAGLSGLFQSMGKTLSAKR
jgi:hypothetical protein